MIEFFIEKMASNYMQVNTYGQIFAQLVCFSDSACSLFDFILTPELLQHKVFRFFKRTKKAAR